MSPINSALKPYHSPYGGLIQSTEAITLRHLFLDYHSPYGGLIPVVGVVNIAVTVVANVALPFPIWGIDTCSPQREIGKPNGQALPFPIWGIDTWRILLALLLVNLPFPIWGIDTIFMYQR